MSVRHGVCHAEMAGTFWHGVCGFWLQVKVASAPPELCHQVDGKLPRDYLVEVKPWWCPGM